MMARSGKYWIIAAHRGVLLRTSSSITWSTETFAQNQNANAIRFGTLYNFRFDADQPPNPTNATVGYFKTGAPMPVLIQAPGGVPTPSPTPTASATPTATPTATATATFTPTATATATATATTPTPTAQQRSRPQLRLRLQLQPQLLQLLRHRNSDATQLQPLLRPRPPIQHQLRHHGLPRHQG